MIMILICKSTSRMKKNRDGCAKAAASTSLLFGLQGVYSRAGAPRCSWSGRSPLHRWGENQLLAAGMGNLPRNTQAETHSGIKMRN